MIFRAKNCFSSKLKKEEKMESRKKSRKIAAKIKGCDLKKKLCSDSLKKE